MSNHPPAGPSNGPPSSGMPIHQQANQGPSPSNQQNMSSQNLNQIVIEYLVKKGYNRTEQMLRVESSNLDKDGRPIHDRVEDFGNLKYARAFDLLVNWIDSNLDIYKFELKRLLWPMFIYSYIEIILAEDTGTAEKFFGDYSPQFQDLHEDELKIFQTIKLSPQLNDNHLTRLYRGSKYKIPLNTTLYYNLLTFLESKSKDGGTVIIYLLQTYCELRETSRGPIDVFSFETIINQARNGGIADEEPQGVPGAFTGISTRELMNNNAALKLGPMPMEPELADDVRADLELEDAAHPPREGQLSLVEEFDRSIKREDSAEGPSRNEIPLPPSRARDIVMEIQKIKEYRDRFKIDSRTDGLGPGVSVLMNTFHNTQDAITCIEFSADNHLVAVGTEESYIRIWHLQGNPLPSLLPNSPPSASRRLIGHSAPVYSLSFSPSIHTPASASKPSTAPRLLLSSSADGTIRLWSLETWTNLIVFKGHQGPVWNVRWGPFGHYFVSGGRDGVVRVWVQDHISAIRLMVGHDTSVSQVAWHPNGAYVFSASDEHDKSVRMWSLVTGECVRIFTGHTEYISALECAPSGKMLASADGGGTIILWDIQKGNMIKRCRGHGKGGIHSLTFSVESTVLVSGGQDNTVRVWDLNLPAADASSKVLNISNDGGEIIAVGGQADSNKINVSGSGAGGGGTGAGGGAGAGGGKKKGKEVMITADQIGAFPTKKTPVYKVMFTNTNCVVAGGCYLP